MKDIYIKGIKKPKNEKAAMDLVFGFLSPITMGVWLECLSYSENRFTKLNSEYFFERSQISDYQLEVSVEELKRKKYLIPFDIEANIWEIHYFPKIKGIHKMVRNLEKTIKKGENKIMTNINILIFKNNPEEADSDAVYILKSANENALSYLSGEAYLIWFFCMSLKPAKIYQINDEYLQEHFPNLTENQIENAIVELKKKKYLCLLDEEANVWSIYEFPQIKGVWG